MKKQNNMKYLDETVQRVGNHQQNQMHNGFWFEKGPKWDNHLNSNEEVSYE